MYSYAGGDLCVCRPGADLVTASTDVVSMWVKIAASWVCLLIYFWSLIAPLILKDREFNWFRCLVAHALSVATDNPVDLLVFMKCIGTSGMC